jgi:hypothetical protein
MKTNVAVAAPEALAAATMKNAVFGNSCRFGGTYCLHLQDRRVSQARNQQKHAVEHAASSHKTVPLHGLATASYLQTQVRFLTQMPSILTSVTHDFPQFLKIYHQAR